MDELTTKEKILQAAQQLFVEHGFAGTSMSKIAKLAGVNHSLLFHHFGNKKNLWVNVKQNISRDVNQQSKILPNTNLVFDEFLRQLIARGIQFYRAHPDIMRMINWQRLEYKSDQKIGVTQSVEANDWLNAFKSYQKRKMINAKLKVEFIVTMVLSIISSAALDQNVFIADKKNQKNYIEFCVGSLLKALN